MALQCTWKILVLIRVWELIVVVDKNQRHILAADKFDRQLLGGYVERDIVSPEVMTEVAQEWALSANPNPNGRAPTTGQRKQNKQTKHSGTVAAADAAPSCTRMSEVLAAFHP